MQYEFPSMFPLFDKGYKHKIKLFGAFVLDSFGTEGTGRYVDLYMKSHDKYFVIKTDVTRKYGNPDNLSIKLMSFDEFGYSRLCTNVIKIDDYGKVSFPELKYFSFKKNTEIVFETVELDDNKKLKLISNMASFSLLAGFAHSTINLTNALKCTRDELINLNFSGKEKDDIFEILYDNDKYQKQCYLRQLEMKEEKK